MKTTTLVAALVLGLAPLGASATALCGSDGVRDTLELAEMLAGEMLPRIC